MRQLDLTDKKILHELDFNSRQPVSVIAKKLKLSRDIVAYRINKFLKDKLLLKTYTIIDISKLGYSASKNFLRFQNITEAKEKEFLNFIKKNENIIYSASYDGKFDVVVSIWSKNIEQLASYIGELEKKFGGFIAERQLATIIKGEYCVRDYLVDKKSCTKRQSFFGSVPEKVKIDETDKKILVKLGISSQASSVEIASSLNISADAVSKRIKKLEKQGIIQNYNIVPNEPFYPYIHHKILITLQDLTEQKERQLEDFCRQNKNIWYFCKALGEWNFEIDMDTQTREEFRNFLRQFKLEFSGIIKDYTILTAYQTNKYNFCPRVP
ncbi:hypothetical protein A3K73_05430 [Candidatus Pacearchaeota archaeon RBG_13_36_9]|nr:MAG: hypothetical protein A3K73_05430 [Candidatus Pacearchaeota archaeon RBG_13_36_9]